MKNIFLLATVSFVFWGCSKAAEDYTVDTTIESAQQVGENMASIDETGGSTNGTLTSNEYKSYEKAFARMSNDEVSKSQAFAQIIFPMAEATACNATTFTTCSASKLTRDYAGCSTAGGGAMTGNTQLTFAGTGAASCTMPMANDYVDRVPNFTVTGLRGATFVVSATSTGQRTTRTGASSFTFSNAGVNRKFTTPKGTVKLDITTSTTSAIAVTGNGRNARTMSGGAMLITNNLTAVACSLTPASIAWTASCNCPTSGTWSGSCTDSSTLSVAFTSTCGQTTVTKDGVASTVTMDRCQ